MEVDVPKLKKEEEFFSLKIKERISLPVNFDQWPLSMQLRFKKYLNAENSVKP